MSCGGLVIEEKTKYRLICDNISQENSFAFYASEMISQTAP